MRSTLLLSGIYGDDFLGGGIVIVFALIMLGIVLLPLIFYLLTLQNTLRLVSPRNRLMEPGLVWLILIPLFGIGWNFKVINDVSESIGREFRARGMHSEPKPGYNVGLASAILILTCWIPCIGALASIAYLVCWIIYWVKIASCKALLENPRYDKSVGDDSTSIFY